MPNARTEHPAPLTEPTALEREGMRDSTPSHPASDHVLNPHNEHVEIDTNTHLGRGALLAIGVVLLALLAAILWGIISRHHAEQRLEDTTHALATPSVFVTQPMHGAQAQELKLPANAEAFVDTPIYSRTNGYLKQWFADIGTSVKKGQLLAIVETPEVDQQVHQAEAEVKTAQANEQIAQTTATRWQNLLAKNAVSRQEADQASSDLSARQAALNAAEANLRRLQQMQAFEHIYAPFAGVITARNVDIGSLIQAGDSNTPHSELFHISSIDKLRLFVPVPEVYTADVHAGEQVQITSDAFPGQTFHGTITRTAETIDPASRTLRTEVDMDNPEHKMLPGQYAFIHLPLPAGANSFTLPSNTILFRAEGLRVGLVEPDNRVHLEPITIGHDYGASVEVTSGLRPNDRVILNPPDSLAEGELVQVEGGHQ